MFMIITIIIIRKKKWCDYGNDDDFLHDMIMIIVIINDNGYVSGFLVSNLLQGKPAAVNHMQRHR